MGAGRLVVVTGASEGIGAAAARRLAASGHRVVVVGRSPDRTAAVAARVGGTHHVADFADLAQVRRLAADLAAAHERIDVLANNAGAVMGDRTLTVDGFERTFQVNHLAAFLLTTLLLPTLSASRATVVATASLGARMYGRGFDLADLQHERGYRPLTAYGRSKLADILFTRELQRRHGATGDGEGVHAVAFHPGVVATGFGRETTHVVRLAYRSPLAALLMRSPERGADQLVRFAEGRPGTDFVPGEYYERGRVARREHPLARDAATARELWDRSAALVGAGT